MNENENLDLNDEKVESEVKVEEKKKSKKGLIALVILLLIGVGVGCFALGQYFSNNSEEGKEDEKKENPVTPGTATLKDYVKDNELVKVDTLTGIAKLYANGVNAGNNIVVDSSYDGYYIVNNSGTFYLKRNQKEVSKIDKNTLKIYKDNTDQNSKYVSVYCDTDGCNFGNLGNENYAYQVAYINDVAKSIIYNINTGKYKIYENSWVNLVEGNSGINFVLEDMNTYEANLVNLSDYSTIKMPKNVYIVGNGVRLGQGDSYFSKSSKYIVVGNKSGMEASKYGLYDYSGNKKIDLIYDDLNTISDDLLIAKKDKKFGVIDSSDKTVIDFVYDGIEAIDNYYVVIKEGKLGVIDKDGKEVVPLNYSVPTDNAEFSMRLCCADENVFGIVKKVNQIIISYYDATKPNNDYRYGYEASYIILNNDSTYAKVDYIDKAYRYSDEFYYYYADGKDLNLYDKDRNLYKTFTCSNEDAYSSLEFLDRDILRYSCGWDNDIYYNITTNKEVTEADVDKRFRDSSESTGELYVYSLEKGKGIFNYNNELLLEINNNEYLEHVYEDYYKIIKADGTVEYYKLKGSYWN